RIGGAVIGLADPGRADRQRFGGDVGSGAGSRIDGVVGRVSSRHADTADADALGGPGVFVGETGAGVAGSEAVAGHLVLRESDCGAGRAVVSLIDTGGADRQ